MSTRGKTAKQVREHKARHPDLYCKQCLWRVIQGNDITRRPCPKHDTLTAARDGYRDHEADTQPTIPSPEHEPIEDPTLTPVCPIASCSGYGVPLGTLGRLPWWRCRHCGIDFHT